MDEQDRMFLAGRKVNVIDLYGEALGVGTLVDDYDLDGDSPTPRIRLGDGRVIGGDECFWMPRHNGGRGRRYGKLAILEEGGIKDEVLGKVGRDAIRLLPEVLDEAVLHAEGGPEVLQLQQQVGGDDER